MVSLWWQVGNVFCLFWVEIYWKTPQRHYCSHCGKGSLSIVLWVMPVAGRRECHSHTLQLKLRSTLHDSVAYRNLTATFHTSLINQVCIIPLKLSFTPTRINKQSKKSLFLLFQSAQSGHERFREWTQHAWWRIYCWTSLIITYFCHH